VVRYEGSKKGAREASDGASEFGDLMSFVYHPRDQAGNCEMSISEFGAPPRAEVVSRVWCKMLGEYNALSGGVYTDGCTRDEGTAGRNDL